MPMSVSVAGGLSQKGLGNGEGWIVVRRAAAGFTDGVVVGWTDFELPAHPDVERAAVWKEIRASNQGVLEEHPTNTLCDEGELGFGTRACEYRFPRI